MMESLYYELHVSVGKEQAEKVKNLLTGYVAYKVSTITGDEPEVIITTRGKYLNLIERRSDQLIILLTEAKVAIKRRKIEIAIVDWKEPATI